MIFAKLGYLVREKPSELTIHATFGKPRRGYWLLNVVMEPWVVVSRISARGGLVPLPFAQL